MIFKPSLDFNNEEGGFYELVDSLVNDIYKQAALIPRLASHLEHADYMQDLEEMEDLAEMKTELMDRMNAVMAKAIEYRNSFDVYAYLWVDDRNEFMRQFLMYNHVLTPEEIEQAGEEGVPESPPTLDQFKEQVGISTTFSVNKHHACIYI